MGGEKKKVNISLKAWLPALHPHGVRHAPAPAREEQDKAWP